MVEADGKITEQEQMALTVDLVKFGVTPDQLELILPAAQTMSAEESIVVVAGFNAEQKKYATGYLAMIMACDGVDESEIKLWRFLSAICGFPTMTIEEAIEYWSKN